MELVLEWVGVDRIECFFVVVLLIFLGLCFCKLVCVDEIVCDCSFVDLGGFDVCV